MSPAHNPRVLSSLDRLLSSFEHALETVFGAPTAARAYPAEPLAETPLDAKEQQHAAGLMRVNHTGEVCAQALYDGQAALARHEENRQHLQQAAAEETDHLAWCAQRLHELNSRPSLLNPVWYAGSYVIGLGAALVSDALSLGFVVETEHQVEAHLAQHIHRLPTGDERSRAILKQMQADEARHAKSAQQRGGIDLPWPLPTWMRINATIMKTIAYRL